MSISEKARSISSILYSLTFSDLEFLKEEIESITKSNVNHIKPKTLYDIRRQVFNYQSTGFKDNTTFQVFEQKNIPQSFKYEYQEVDLYSPISQSFIKIEEPTSTQKSSRPLGIWKGKVEISEDFNKTSSDILSEFGIEE